MTDSERSEEEVHVLDSQIIRMAEEEDSSVPDHIRLYKQETGKGVTGVFCAPAIHERNTAAMRAAIAPYGIELHCITDQELEEM